MAKACFIRFRIPNGEPGPDRGAGSVLDFGVQAAPARQREPLRSQASSIPVDQEIKDDRAAEAEDWFLNNVEPIFAVLEAVANLFALTVKWLQYSDDTIYHVQGHRLSENPEQAVQLLGTGESWGKVNPFTTFAARVSEVDSTSLSKRAKKTPTFALYHLEHRASMAQLTFRRVSPIGS